MALLQKAYLGATPLFRDITWFEEVSSNIIDQSSAVTVTANSSAHTKGAYAELVASTSANASYIVIHCEMATNATNTSTLLDIATGASGSETVLIGDVAVGGAVRSAGTRCPFAFGVPIKIPSGTRLSARIQSVVTGGKTGTVVVRTYESADYNAAPTSVDVIGTDTATSTGTAMSGSSGTYVQIIASTSRAYRAVAIVPSCANNTTNIPVTFTLGTGASGSETAKGAMVAHYTSNEEVGMTAYTPPIAGGAIAASTRLAIKHDIAASPSNYNVTLIGIP
jgi:hypothetical protein